MKDEKERKDQLVKKSARLRRQIAELAAPQGAGERLEQVLDQSLLWHILEASPLPIAYIDSEQYYRFNNRAYEEWFRRPRAEIYGKHVEEIVGHTAYQIIRKYIKAVLAGQSVAHETLMSYKDAGTRYVRATYVPHWGGQENIVGYFAFTEDLTSYRLIEEMFREAHDELGNPVRERMAVLKVANEQLQEEVAERRRIEKALRENESRYRTLFENSKDAIVISHEGRLIEVNQAASELWGYTREELLELDPQGLYANPQDRQRMRQEMEQKGSVRNFEIKYRRKDRTEIDCLFTGTVYRADDGSILGYQGIMRDITERKRVEKQLFLYQQQLRSLSSALVLTEERERRRIATDLHDSVGQALAAVQIKLGALAAAVSGTGLDASVKEVRVLIDQIIQDTRSLTFDLSPPVLYELGLEAAVEWLAEQVQEQHGVQFEIEDDSLPKPLDDDVCASLFRSVRELLINVVKHAQVQRAKIFMRREDQNIWIEIKDEGIGFDSCGINFHMNKPGGFGLFSIRERLSFMGGSFQIESALGRGTRAVLVAPLK